MQILDCPPLDIVTLLLEHDDDMPTNKELLEDHEKRIKQVEGELHLRPAEPKKTLWERKQEWVRSNPGISILLPIALACMTIFGGYWLNHRKEWWNEDVDRRVQIVMDKPGGIKETLANIQTTVNKTETTLNTLAPFINELINHQFESASKLPTKTLQERLPALQHLFAVARDQEVKVDTKILNSLTQKLTEVNTNANGFWPATAEFISYRSAVVSSPVGANLRNCSDQEPKPARVVDVQQGAAAGGLNQIHFSMNEYDNCKFTLDSPKDDNKVNSLIASVAPFLSFHHCLIVYRGGQVNLILAVQNVPYKVTYRDPGTRESSGSETTFFTGATLRFQDCIFDFSTLAPPPQKGQEVTKILLAQSASLADIKLQVR
jgi:hypothetical protein